MAGDHSNNKKISIFFLLSFLTIALVGVQSFSFVSIEDRHLHDKAQVIVVGTIQTALARWESVEPRNDNSNNRKLVTTEYLVEVEELIKGSTESLLIKVCVNGGPIVSTDEIFHNDTVLIIPGTVWINNTSTDIAL